MDRYNRNIDGPRDAIILSQLGVVMRRDESRVARPAPARAPIQLLIEFREAHRPQRIHLRRAA